MKTIEDVKQDLYEHLLSIDKSKLTLYDLRVYADVVHTLEPYTFPALGFGGASPTVSAGGAD